MRDCGFYHRVNVPIVRSQRGTLLVGVALSIAFTTGHEYVASLIFLGLALSGLALPVYRAAYLLLASCWAWVLRSVPCSPRWSDSLRPSFLPQPICSPIRSN